MYIFFIRRRITIILLAILLLIAIGAAVFFYFAHASYEQSASAWNEQKATYLAQRVLLDPTPADIQKLTQAGSASAAVSILLATSSPQEEQAYQAGLAAVTAQLNQAGASGKNKNAGAIARETEYAYQLIHNPDDAQQKLEYLWENTFSVDNQIDPGDEEDKISDGDVAALNKILYDNAYGNYIDLVGKVQTTYAMGKYLDLISSSQKDPNENYSREFMQLFLMGQYTPLDTKLSTPNYSDADVNALAYLLTGYKGSLVNGTNTVTFNPKAHYTGSKMFLGNTVSFTDPEQAIPYILSQRRTQISEFLSNKILKYYVSDAPESQDIVTFAGILSQNNFEIEPSLKWLFTSDIMYRPEYMQEERYKSPVELVASYYTTLYGRNNYAIIPDPKTLGDLGFEPMKPGSIFGRPGFGSNILFYSGTILDKWIGDTDRSLRETAVTPNLQKFLATTISTNNITTPEGLVEKLENTLYLGKTLPSKTQDAIVAFLTANNTVTASVALDTTNPDSLSRMQGTLDLLFAQPEFIMVGGNPATTTLPPPLQPSSSTATSSILVVVRLHGGMDYQQLVANIKDPDYATNRLSLDLAGSSTPLGNGYVLNNAAKALLPLIQSKNAFLVTAVGLPGQVRAHDIASQQMETGLSPTNTGIGASLEKADPSLNLVSLTDSPPIFYKGAASLQMGSANLTLFPELKDNTSPTGQLQTFEQILHDRVFPSKSALFYSQTVLLNQLGEEDIASGGKGTPGPTNATQFPFLESLITKHIGNVYYLYADDTYDFHFQEDPKFDEQISAFTKQIADFYDTESKTTNLTIVIFTEFGRTDKINGNEGTDHGTGGGMTVISNSIHWPTMIGNMTPSTDPNNWTNVVVDERDVWSSIFNSLYGVPVNTLFGRSTLLSSYPVTIQ
jgi:uncharacterized protein (DUF1800 family)